VLKECIAEIKYSSKMKLLKITVKKTLIKKNNCKKDTYRKKHPPSVPMLLKIYQDIEAKKTAV